MGRSEVKLTTFYPTIRLSEDEVGKWEEWCRKNGLVNLTYSMETFFRVHLNGKKK